MGLNDLLSTIDDIKKQDTKGKAAGAMNQAYGTNPDQYAEFIRLEKDTGRPASWMAEDSTIADEAKRSTFLDGRKLEMLPSHVQNYLSVPDNAKVSHDDLDGLTGISNVMGIATKSDRKTAQRAKSIGSAFVEGISSSPERINQGLATTGQKVADVLNWSLSAFPDETGMRKRVADIAGESADYWRRLAEEKAPAKKAGTSENYVQQAGSSIGTSLLAAPFGAGGQGAALGMFGLFSEGNYADLKKAGYSVPYSAALSTSNQMMEGLTEKIGLDRIYKGTGPIIKKALGFLLGDLAGEEINTIYSDIADKVTIKPDMTMADVVQSVADTAIVTAIAGGAQGVSMAGAAHVSNKVADNLDKMAEAKKQSDFLTALGDSVKASKTFARLPDNVKDLIRNIKQDGDVHDIFVPVEKVNQLFQSKGLNAEQQMQQILSEPSRYYEALATGGDVAIPLEDFAALAGDEIYGELIGDARTHIDGMSMNEAKQFDKPEFQAEYVKSLLAEVDKIGAETTFQTETEQSAYKQFYDDTYGQLIGIGRNAEQSDKEATLRAKMLTTLMQRGGYSAEYLQEMFPITITRGPLPNALQKPKGADVIAYESQIGAMIDKLRSGKAPKPSELFGPSLLEFLRDKGIQDQGGELSKMDIDKGQKFKKKVVRPDGLTLDKAREAAVEAGYLSEDSSVADFLELVDQEARGNAVYSSQSGNQALQDEALSLQQLQQWIDDMGIDLQTSDNAKLLQLMQSVEGGSQLNQAAHIGTDNFKKWSNNAPFINAAEAMTHEFKSGEKVVVEGFHGTARPDRVGTQFKKSRATSGPMSFFTSNPEVASNYAQGKQDTSITEENVYDNWFKFKPKGARSFTDISRAWYFLTSEQKQIIFERMGDIRTDDDGNIIYEEGGGDIGSYEWELKQTQKGYDRRGNPLKAAVETWLTSGSLFGEEEQFMKVLELAGFPIEEVKYEPPNASYPFVYKTYISMQSPLVTSDIPQTVVDALDETAKKDRSRAKQHGADAWDKNIRTLKEWVAEFHTENNQYVWTSIPDKVTEVFKSLGYDGIIDVGGKSGGDVHKVFIPFEEYQVKSAIGNKGTYDINKPDILKQQKRGYIQFTKGVPGFEIALLKDADASTFVHELSHYYFEILGTLAGQKGAPDRVKADYESLLKWLGAETTESLTVRQKEQLADGFLEYMTEGKAPSTELQGVFSRFKTWLKAIYLTFKNADVQLTDEVRQIFDRWLATDEEIETARNQIEAKPMFATAKDAGMSERVFEAYKKLAEDAHEAAKSRLDAVKYKEANRVYQTWWKEALAGITAEVEQEAKDNPVFEALNVIRNGELFDGTKFEGESSRLNGAVLKRMYDSPTLKAFARKLGPFYQNEGGINPEDMAEMFGFGSADEMVRKMVEAPKMKDWVKAEAQKRMEERYPEKNSVEIADDALAAVNNDDLARVFREELKAIKRKQKEVKPFLKAEEQGKNAAREEAFDSIPPLVFFKGAARQHIASMKVADIKPGLYARAEQKAGKEAIEFNGKDKFTEAAAAKQRQILNHYLYREAVEAKERADKTLVYMRKLETGKKQSALGKAGQEYLDQINNILDQYEFRRIPLREIEARESLLDWVLKKEESTGQKFPIDPVLLADAEQVNYRTLTVGKLDEIYKTAKLIDFLAMNHNKLLKDQQNRDLMEIGDEVAAGVELYGGKKKPRQPEKSLPQDMPGKLLRNYLAGMRAMSSLARQMDGGQDGGVVWQTLIRPLNEAGDNESAMHAAATDRADKIFSVYSAKERMTMTLRKMVPGSDISLSHWGRLMVALNMGNEGNLDRLRSTLSDKDIAAVLDSLDERDLKFVQDVWDWLESFKPQIAAKEKRVNGIEPEWVVATPLQTRFGTLAGGYFPIFYDLVESERAEALDAKTIEMQMNGGMFSHATTRRGHLESRLDHIGRPLDLDISNIFNHVNQVIHDLTHHEALIDLNKIMNLQSIKDSMRDYYGPEAYRIFRDGITDVAVGTIPARNAWEWWNQYTRIGATTAALGWNITTSLLQPLGLTQSIVRIGPEYVAKGVMQWLGSPKKMYSEIPEMIYSKSTFMKHRAQSMNRELAEVSGKIKPGVVPHVIKDSYFFLIQEMQKVVDVPTWLGQYEKSMTTHGNESDAIAEADQAVIDAQAHGQQKDLSRFQRGGPFEKLFTMFSSYFVRTWNLAAESYGQTNFKSAASVGKFTVDIMMLYVIPAAITSAVFDVAIQAAIGGDPDEDKFWMGFFSKMLGGVIAPLPGFNQLGSLLSGYLGYEGPAGTRIYSEISKAAKQIGQGESDWALWKSIIGTGGVLFHAPTGQTIKSISGIMELQEGNGNALSLMFGKPKK